MDLNRCDKMENNFESYSVNIPVKMLDECSASELRVYARIQSLTTKNGHCWASNSYLAKRCDLAKGTISNIIASLVKKGWLVTFEKIEKDEFGNHRTKRIIQLPLPNFKITDNGGGYTESVEGVSTETMEGVSTESVEHNNIKENNKKDDIYLNIEGVKIYDLKKWMVENIGVWLDRQTIPKKDDVIKSFMEHFVQYEFKNLNHLRNTFTNFIKGKVYQKEKTSGKKEKGNNRQNIFDKLKEQTDGNN